MRPGRRTVGPWAPGAALAVALAALLLGAAGPTEAAAVRDGEDPPAAEATEWEILDRRPADGEQCIVCKLPTRQGDIVEVRYKGRRFHVSAKMLADFEADPEAYFRDLEAHGGLFDEAAMETPPMRTGWLLFGVYVLVGLVAGAACSYVALDHGLPAWGWFFAGLAANVMAVAVVLLRARGAAPAAGRARRGPRKIPVTHSPVACGHCGESNHPAAAACASCGRALEPSVEPEMARA